MLVIAAIWALAMSRWVLSDQVVPWDSKNQFYAFFRFLGSSLAAGESPFWNPYHYGGHPSIADPQSLIFAPLMVLYALFDPAPSLLAFDIVVHVHLLIGALSLAALGARAGWPAVACVLAAAVFMFGGAAAGRLQHTGIILSYGLFPLALLLLEVALARRSLLGALAFAVVAATVALGRNQVAMLLCYVLVLVPFVGIVTAPAPAAELRARAPVLAVMGVAVIAIIAVPMLLTIQFGALSNRPVTTLDQALLGSLHPAALAQLAVADIFGSHGRDYWGPGAGTEPLVALTNDCFYYLFVGVVPVILVLWFGIAGGGVLRRGRRLFAAVAALAMLYAMGRYTPVFGWAFDWMPGVEQFRRPVDASFVVLAMLAPLCGALAADYVREGVPRLNTLRAALAIVLAMGALVCAVLFAMRTQHGRDAIAAMPAHAAAAAAVMLLLWWCGRTARRRSLAAMAVTALAVIELLAWNAAFRLNAQPRSAYAVLHRPTGETAAALAALDRLVDERHRAGERPRVEVVGLGGPWQNLAMVRGLEAANGYNPLRIGRYDRLVAPGEENWRLDMRTFPASFASYDGPLARRLGLEFLVIGRPIEQLTGQARQPDTEVIQAGPEVWIYRLRHTRRRLAFIPRIELADADRGPVVSAAVPSGAIDIRTDTRTDTRTPPASLYGRPGADGASRLVFWRPSRVEIATDSTSAGVLVLYDLWYPGWIVEVDGVQATLLRAGALFRAVELPAGPHHVVFRFAPLTASNLAAALHDLAAHRR